MQVAVDTGGTFTDLVTDGGRVEKVLSTPRDPGGAIREAIAAAARQAAGGGPRNGGTEGQRSSAGRPGDVRGGESAFVGDRPALLAHGTTVATNALLERRVADVVLVATGGLADVIEIARQDRPSLYDQLASRPEPLVPRGRRHEVRGRLAGDGSEIAPVDVGSLAHLGTGGDVPDREPGGSAGRRATPVVAVCLLHADVNPAHERAVAEALHARSLDVTCSHQVSPEMREYERTVTTVINAALRPRCREYLRGIADVADDVLVMTSAGGLLPAFEAAELPAAILLSGPAGGVRAGAAAAVANGFPDAVTFDMGGTSTDVCLVLGGAPAPAAQREVGGFAVRFPSLDIHTIGAGGGSIAGIDPGGALAVGPRSAGADPGPACYGRGGDRPTVTDANLAAGRIPEGAAFGGLRLDRVAAGTALERAGVTAEGVLAVVDANMERALRAVSVERGVDPRGLALVAFGGAGPLHACALADALGMPAVVVPARAGVASAVGLLTAPRRRDLVRSWPRPSDHRGLDEALAAVAEECRRLVAADGDGGDVLVETAVDCRYLGQSHELTVPDLDAFHAEHRRRNGYARVDAPVEAVALRATAARPPGVALNDLPAAERLARPVRGPAVIAEGDCTVWVAEGWTARNGAAGALLLQREETV